MSLADRARVPALLEVRVTVLDDSKSPAPRIEGMVSDLRDPDGDHPAA